ncbi:ty3-gypsy retrotransposon protein [Tanacetum coccineum]|uniref:Ty3-gypsy retrotransposon protein n=1 Tax=Tanacetum coccineum TaxID=301880 RepID=A0ABQ4Z0F2_9ASTR
MMVQFARLEMQAHMASVGPLWIGSCPFEDSHVLLPTEPSVLSEPFETPQISLHALTGQFVPMTLKIPGLLKKHQITVLIDGGSTHNFIQSRLVFLHGFNGCNFSPFRQSPLVMEISLNCGGFCAQTTLVMGQHDFTMDLLILPLYGAYIVLGVQWSPPSLKDYLTGTSPVATLDDLLSTRTHLLDQLKSKLLKAQLPSSFDFPDTAKVLVQWQNQPIIDATWENLLEFRQDFSSFNLEVKVSPDEWAMI